MYVLERTRHEEKRDFLRMQMDIPITLTHSHSGDTIQAVCKDLSGTGMLVESDTEVRAGDTYDVSVPSSRPDLDLGSLEATVEVTRVLPRAGGFELGLKIQGIKA